MRRFDEKLESMANAVRSGDISWKFAIRQIEEANVASLEQILLFANERARSREEVHAAREEQMRLSADERVRAVEEAHAARIENIARQHAMETEHRREVSDLEKNRLQTIIDAERLAKNQSIAEQNLLTKIGGIVGHYHIDPVSGRISYSSLDISRKDVFQRHSIVSEIYEKKFMPFRELLPAGEFGQVGNYIRFTTLRPSPAKEPLIDLSPVRGFIGWEVNEAQYNRMISLCQKFFGYFPAPYNTPGTGRVHLRIDALNGIVAAGNAVNAELEKRYQADKKAYDAEVARATAVSFPSCAFDALARKVNELLAKLR
jgi:hypothetical protein